MRKILCGESFAGCYTGRSIGMASESQPGLSVPPEPSGERWGLLQRVVASPGFQKANRVRDFLLFVGARSLADPPIPVHEPDIGREVFGRAEDYDTSQDTIVRVQASQLRRKLEQYFANEGAAEPYIIEMPKGSYSLVFQRRTSNLAAPAASFWSRFAAWAWIGAAVFALLTIALATQNVSLMRRADLGQGPRPLVDRFWRQAFVNGQRTYLTLADATLMVLQDRIGRHLTLEEYELRAFDRLSLLIPNDEVRGITLTIANRQLATVGDAALVYRFGLVAATNGVPLDVGLARNITSPELTSNNVILLGSRRSNPWVGLYEDKLNFQTEFTESPRIASFVNRSPRAGERSSYAGQWGRLGYCRVAFLPNLRGTGNALLISGTDVQSTDAGGIFVVAEQWMVRLRSALGIGARDDMPYFEVLLEGPVATTGMPRFEMIAVRKH